MPSSDNSPIIGNSPTIERVRRMVEKAAPLDIPVLIKGETGTGKDLVAAQIHAKSQRAQMPFIPVNMGMISRELVASELFGHVRGAFTGADSAQDGRFVDAHTGTIFLDEAGTMEERTQIALLRVLESNKFRPLGAKRDRAVDVRIISATNTDLEEAVEVGEFRADLLHRLQVLRIDIPALREHIEDIPVLAEHFMHMANRDFGFEAAGISEDAIALMSNYNWPGNIRELKHIIQQTVVMTEKGMIETDQLPERLKSNLRAQHADAEQTGQDIQSDRETAIRPASTPDGIFFPLDSTLDEVQQMYALEVLKRFDNNKSKAARALGISRKTLYERLKRWKI